MASDFERAEGARAMRALLESAAALVQRAEGIAESIGYADHGKEEAGSRLADARAALDAVAEDCGHVVWYATEGA